MKNPGFHSRLVQLIGDEQPFSWAKRMGISKGAFSRIWNEGSVPGSEHLVGIKNRTGVSLDWLLTGEKEVSVYEKSPSVDLQLQDQGRRYEVDEFVAIPHYDVRAAAGHGAVNYGEEQLKPLSFRRDWLAQRRLSAGNLFVVGISGSSMEPYLSDGDVALADKSQTNVVDGKTYVLRLDGNLLVKNLQLLPQGLIQVASFNPGFPPYAVDLTNGAIDVAVIGRVIMSMHEWH